MGDRATKVEGLVGLFVMFLVWMGGICACIGVLQQCFSNFEGL